MYRRLIIPFCWLMFFLGPGIARGQYDDSIFVRYTFRDGLIHNYITALQQDEFGYIWIGTPAGVTRFDGYGFRNFNSENDVRLPSGNIRQLKKLEKGQLSILTTVGLYLLNTRDYSTRLFRIPDSTQLSLYLNACWDAQLLPDHSYAVTTAAGFYVFRPDGSVQFRYDAFTLNDLSKRILFGREIIQVTKNDLLVYTDDNELAHYDIKKRQLQEEVREFRPWNIFRLYPNNQGMAPRYRAVSISSHEYLSFFTMTDTLSYYDHDRNLYVKSHIPVSTQRSISWESKPVAINDSLFAVNSSQGGYYTFLLDRKSGKIRFNPQKFLQGHTINILFVDKDKRLWAGTRNGLLRQRLNEKFISSQYYPPDPSDLNVVGYQSAYRYKDKLYLSRFSQTHGLAVVDTASGQIIKRVQFFENNSSWNEISSMILYHPDTLWLGTARGPLWFDVKTHTYGKIFDPKTYPLIPESTVHFYPPNRDGYAWFFFFMEGQAIRYHIKSRKMDLFGSNNLPPFPFLKVKSLAYDSYGDVWFGGHALTRWNSQLQRFDTMMTAYGGANKFNENILMLTADDHGSLWLHNTENGLLEYRIREKKFIPYTTRDGLPSNILQAFSPVVKDILWISTSNSLVRFDTRTKKSFVYDHNDGYPDESPNIRRMYLDTALDKLYLPCKEYIAQFPASIHETGSTPGDILIQEFRVNDQKSWYHPDEEIRLRYNENSISIRFNFIDFESPNSYQLAYRINKEQNWTISGKERLIQLKGLPSGDHIIEIKATGKNGEEKVKKFAFRIAKPFWKTNAFLVGVVLLVTGLAIYLYRRRLRAIHQKANIDKQIAQTQMKALHAQMNPHFVFNSLNSIREMILNNESKEASHFLSKFAQLMRMTLDHSIKTFISLRSTMEYLQRYMEMEQIRNDQFTCRVLADEELDPDETTLPPMLIQPFIENAIWHGVSDTSKDININIDFIKEEEQLVCIIDDNGMGIERSMLNKKHGVETHVSVGIANIRNRVKLLNEKYGLASSVEIIDKSTLAGQLHGTRVTIRLPLQNDE